MDVPINYLAVVVAAAAQIALGFAWYGPLFGKKWAHLSGISMEKMQKPPVSTMVLMALGALVMAFVLQHALVFATSYLQISGISAGLQTGFWNWLGFVAPVTMSVVLWEGKSWTLWAINSGYYLVGLSLMGTILALWQ
jgi:hypothetical protein